MADEIQYRFSGSVENGEFKETLPTQSTKVDQTAIGRAGTVQEIGIVEEVVTIAEITTLGWCFLKNLDTTNFVSWGPESALALVKIGRLEAGEIAWFRLEPGIILRAQANTAAVELQVIVFED